MPVLRQEAKRDGQTIHPYGVRSQEGNRNTETSQKLQQEDTPMGEMGRNIAQSEGAHT